MTFFKTWILFCLIFTFSCFAIESSLEKETDEMNAAKKEAKNLGKESNKRLISLLEDLFENKTALISQDDLLPEKEKGKRFNRESAEARMETNALTPFEIELEQVVRSASKKEQFEGSEEFFSGATVVLSDPESQVGIESYETRIIDAEEIFETCSEEGSFESFVDQKRVIHVTPEEREIQSACLGHIKTKSFFWKSEAEAKKQQWNDKLLKDTSLKFFHVRTYGEGPLSSYLVTKNWTHKDGVSCSQSITYEKTIREGREEDVWEAEDPKAFSYLEESPKCRLIYSTPLDDPGNRVVFGKDVSRDCWKRRLFFSCTGEEHPKCRKIREEGGRIVSKQCLKKTPSGECELWEKKYKIGGQTAFVKTDVQFKEDSIWGVGEFEEASELGNDFGDAISKLAAVSDLKGNTEIAGPDILKAAVFKGDTFKCRKSFAKDLLYDCCGDLSGFATDIGLAGCSSEERSLYQKRKEGKCHYIGIHSTKMGLEKEKVYCCFPTQLARIIQEEGRSQLGVEWGSEDCPKCQGLTLDQIKKLDFDQMDFSDFILEVHQKIDQETLRRKLQSHAQNFSQRSGASATKAFVEIEQGKILEGGKDD